MPAHVFQGVSFFVIEAVPFSFPRLEWAERHNHCWFFVKMWSFSEVLQAYVKIVPSVCHNAHIFCSRPYLLHKERELWYLYHEYGASVGALADFAHIPSSCRDMVIRDVKALSLDPESQTTLSNLHTHTISATSVIISPSPTSRSQSKVRIASRRVAGMLRDERSNSPNNVAIGRCTYHSFWLR